MLNVLSFNQLNIHFGKGNGIVNSRRFFISARIHIRSKAERTSINKVSAHLLFSATVSLNSSMSDIILVCSLLSKENPDCSSVYMLLFLHHIKIRLSVIRSQHFPIFESNHMVRKRSGDG